MIFQTCVIKPAAWSCWGLLSPWMHHQNIWPKKRNYTWLSLHWFKGQRSPPAVSTLLTCVFSSRFTPGAAAQLEKKRAGPSQADVEAVKVQLIYLMLWLWLWLYPLGINQKYKQRPDDVFNPRCRLIDLTLFFCFRTPSPMHRLWRRWRGWRGCCRLVRSQGEILDQVSDTELCSSLTRLKLNLRIKNFVFISYSYCVYMFTTGTWGQGIKIIGWCLCENLIPHL